MYHHVKKLMYTLRVDQADPKFGNMLLEQFGGANGELAAAMQYSIQGLNCDDLERKDLLMNPGTHFPLRHVARAGEGGARTSNVDCVVASKPKTAVAAR
jgi:Mn-containing catalase